MLRPALPSDMAAVQAIYARHVRDGIATFEELPPDVAELGRRYEAVTRRGLPWLVAEEAGAVLGYAYAGLYRDRSAYRFTVEDSIYLAPEAQGRGIGRALLARLIADCTQAGARQMLAVIGDSGNAGSIGLHTSLGFAPVGTLRSVGYKHRRWIDVVLMQLPLGDGEGSLPEG